MVPRSSPTCPTSPQETRRVVGDAVELHDVDQSVVDGLDPLTYEVIRHRLTSITEEMGEALKRMSGSVVVTDCNDFDAAIMDEVGDVVQVGLYNTELAASLDMAVNWTLRNRARPPRHRPGRHVPVQRPVGRRRSAPERRQPVRAAVHRRRAVLPGPAPSPTRSTSAACRPAAGRSAATDVFWESVPTPPVKIVEGGEIRDDIEDVYLRRSRVPKLVALDLRAKIGANNVAHERLRTLCTKYGADDGQGRDAPRSQRRRASAAQAKLTELPDGSWTAVAHQDSARSGDRGHLQDRLHADQDRRQADVRLHRHRPAGRRTDQLHLRRPARRDHAGAAHHPVRGHPLGARRALPLPGNRQRAGHHQQLHLPVRHRQGVGGLGVGDDQRGHRVPGRPARRPSGAPQAADERVLRDLGLRAARRRRPARRRIRHDAVRFHGRRSGCPVDVPTAWTPAVWPASRWAGWPTWR